MFSGFSEDTGSFFWDLMLNNERPWFKEHKEKFESCLNTPFRELGSDTFGIMNSKYPMAGFELHMSRIYRDARRLFGRGPYKDNLWFTIKNRKSGYNGPAFFFEIRPESWCYGLGFYSEKADVMERFRKAVSANPPAFERLAKSAMSLPGFTVEGDKYKRLKGDFGKVINDFYNRRFFSVVRNFDFGKELFDPELPKKMAADFVKLMPLFTFLEEASENT